MKYQIFILAILATPLVVDAAEPRARDLGIPFDGTPGTLNAITDVPGVTVGHSTIIEDYPNGSAARSGVTAVLPRGEDSIMLPAFAGTAVLNGAGEMTGAIWVEASGFLEGPVMITTTQSVGMVFEETIKWRVNNAERDVTGYAWSDPVVAETWGGRLNDENGFYVHGEHVVEAIETAQSGPVAEGNVGGGTGMVCYQFKCGIGTASRVVETEDGKFTVGVACAGELWLAGYPADCGRAGWPRDSGRAGGRYQDADGRRDGFDYRCHRYRRAAAAAPIETRRHARRIGNRTRWRYGEQWIR